MKEVLSYIEENEDISIRCQCELLEVNRSTVYYKPAPESEENLAIMRLMDEHHLDHPTHGVLQMQDYLFMCSFIVNTKRVRRLLRLMGIMALYPKRNLSKLGLAKYIRPYLLKGLTIERPNQVWGIDITYIPMANGFMYLTAIIDLYSRYIVGWDVFNSLIAENTLEVLKQAIASMVSLRLLIRIRGVSLPVHFGLNLSTRLKSKSVWMAGAGPRIIFSSSASGVR